MESKLMDKDPQSDRQSSRDVHHGRSLLAEPFLSLFFLLLFHSLSFAFKVMASRPHLKRIPTCYIYPYTDMRTRTSTHMIPLEAIPR